MRRHFTHIVLNSSLQRQQRLLPAFLHFDEGQWQSANREQMWRDVFCIITENMEIIQERARGHCPFDSPPIQLTAESGLVTLAFTIHHRSQPQQCYTVLTCPATNETNAPAMQPQVIEAYDLYAWIFSVDSNQPFAPLPLECG